MGSTRLPEEAGCRVQTRQAERAGFLQPVSCGAREQGPEAITHGPTVLTLESRALLGLRYGVGILLEPWRSP